MTDKSPQKDNQPIICGIQLPGLPVMNDKTPEIITNLVKVFENITKDDEIVEKEAKLLSQLGLLENNKKINETIEDDDDDEIEIDDDEGSEQELDEDLDALIPLTSLSDNKKTDIPESEEVKSKKQELLDLLGTMSEDDYSRYVYYRRARFPTVKVKRIMSQVCGKIISDKVATLVAGLAKLLVRDVVSNALDYQNELSETADGLQPKHIREGYRRFKYQEIDKKQQTYLFK